ncbi:MAG: TlpA disulfide reductase family protein [Pseudomonadota bacterium]
MNSPLAHIGWQVPRWLVAVAAVTLLLAHGGSKAESITTFDGAPMQLADLSERGQWTVVMFWSTTCHICDHEIPKYADFAREGGPIKVKGVSVDGARATESVQRYLTDRNVDYQNYITDPLRLQKDYESSAGESFMGTPTFWLFSPEGKLIGINPGPLKIASLKRFVARKTQ